MVVVLNNLDILPENLRKKLDSGNIDTNEFSIAFITPSKTYYIVEPTEEDYQEVMRLARAGKLTALL